MNKLKAFTLFELLIGMIISSLVIGFSLMSYFIVYKQFMNYRATKQTLSDITFINTVLQNDFRNAEMVKQNNEEEYIFDYNYTLVYYNFQSDYILRKMDDHTDTFKIIVTDIIPLYLTTSENSNYKTVQSISFDSEVLGEKERFSFSKQYAADVLVNDTMFE